MDYITGSRRYTKKKRMGSFHPAYQAQISASVPRSDDQMSQVTQAGLQWENGALRGTPWNCLFALGFHYLFFLWRTDFLCWFRIVQPRVLGSLPLILVDNELYHHFQYLHKVISWFLALSICIRFLMFFKFVQISADIELQKFMIIIKNKTKGNHFFIKNNFTIWFTYPAHP